MAVFRYKDGVFIPLTNTDGHTIIDSNGNAVAKEDKIKFVGSNVTDDTTIGATVVTTNADTVGAVSTSVQVLSETQKEKARQNIGASDFDGDYSSLNNKPTLGEAAAKDVADSTSAEALSTGSSLVTERDVYYGTPKINNSKGYTSDTSIYAPTGGGSSGQYLKAAGSTSTPTWQSADTTPTNGSANLITSGAVFTGLSAKASIQFTTTDPGANVSTNYDLIVVYS